MNCAAHPDVAAVAACGHMSRCREASEFTFENKPVCRQCNYNFLVETIAEDEKTKGWTMVKLILGGVCVLAALVALIAGAGIENVILVAAPILVIVNIIKLKKCNARLQRNTEMLANFAA